MGLLRYEQMRRREKSRVHGAKVPVGIAKEARVKNGVDRYQSDVLPLADSGEQEISPASISEHALATFGSIEKAQHWMNRRNPLFQGKTPSQVMQTDPLGVEAELTRIDHGVYV